MTFQERKKKILAALDSSETLTVFELADLLEASPATIRRDLGDIAEEGLLLRTHGGAMRIDHPVLTGFSDKSGINNSIKERIAAIAASYVSDGDTIFLDCGSTVFQMCRFIKKKNIRVVTNSLPILAELMEAPTVSVNLIGGEVDKARRAVHGQKAVQHILGYHAQKAFIGVDGLSVENGLTAHSEHESTITSAFMQSAGQVMLLCDASKIGKDSYIKFGSLSEIHTLITDDMANAKILEAIRQAGVIVETAAS